MQKLWIILVGAMLILGCNQNTGVVEKKVENLPTNKPVIVDLSKSQPIPDADKPLHIYPFKSGRFAFEVMGPGVKNGNLSIFIDNYGDCETKRSMKTMDNGSRIAIWTIKKGLDIFSVHPQEKEVITAKMATGKSAALDMEILIAEHGSKEEAEKYLLDNKITLLSDEKIEGYNCQVYETESNGYIITRWVHKGLELQMAYRKVDGEQVISRKLVKAEFGRDIPAEQFEYPENFTVR